MTLLMHISDTHFGTEQAPVVAALLELALSQRPDLVVLSGDITQRASSHQFAQAKAFCEQLRVPKLLALPGNHDIPLGLWTRISAPYARYQAAFGSQLEPTVQTANFNVIGVNTTRAWRHKNGQVSSAQINRVSRQLAQARPEQLRLVVVHQPLHVLRAQDEPDRLRGAQAAARAWAAAGADIVMGGHIHLPYVAELTACDGGLARRMWCVQAGTAVSRRVRRGVPNSVNLLRYAPAELRCEAEQWDYSANAGQFQRVRVHGLALQRP